MGAAALLVGDRVATAYARGGWTFVHGETQAGTPACAAAVLAVIDGRRRIDVEATAQALATALHRLTRSWQDDGIVTDATGSGCFVGLGLRRPDDSPLSGTEVLEVVSAISDSGVVVHPGPSSFQLIPGYGFSPAELAETDRAVRAGLARVRAAAA